jgi:hypothetical protein
MGEPGTLSASVHLIVLYPAARIESFPYRLTIANNGQLVASCVHLHTGPVDTLVCARNNFIVHIFLFTRLTRYSSGQ